MKILCCCHIGYKRSRIMRRYLLQKGHDVLQAGLGVNSRETIELLSEWADKILLAEPDTMILHINDKYHDKVELAFDVGPDNYEQTHTDPRLIQTVKEQMEGINL